MGLVEFDLPPAVPLSALALKRGRRWNVGDPFPRVEVTARRLLPDAAAYARVCGFPLADPLPVTYPDVLARGLQLAALTSRDFPLPVLGILHTEQRIEAVRPIAATEALAGRVWIEGPRVARQGGEFDLHTVITSAGQEVWHGTTTILSRALRGDGVKRPRPQEPAWQTRRSVVWSLPADQGRRYAAVSGDTNPIHLWPVTARLFGFKRPIAHGWWALARALAEMDVDVPSSCVITARFAKPLPLPGKVTFASGPLANGAGQRFELRRKDVAVSGEVRPR